MHFDENSIILSNDLKMPDSTTSQMISIDRTKAKMQKNKDEEKKNTK